VLKIDRACTSLIVGLVGIISLQSSCGLTSKLITNGGQVNLKSVAAPASPTGPHVVIFALDGAGHDQFIAAATSGKAPNIAAVLGRDLGDGMFAHAYSAPNALSMLPSSTVADWSAIFTGDPPAWNGVVGDEWFQRQSAEFHAPVPLSTDETTDVENNVANDLVGKTLKVPTLYQLINVQSNVSLLPLYHGATRYTVVSPTSFPTLMGDLLKGKLSGETTETSVAAALDTDSVPKLLDAIQKDGIPGLQVVYFPGIDAFTHGSANPLKSQINYIEKVTDPLVGKVLDAYRQAGLLDGTYIIFIADHGHTPTDNDGEHELGADGDDTPFALVRDTGYRVRKPSLKLAANEQDYQAVLAYQGFMSYIYLADRATCPKPGEHCDWSRPPRYREDVAPLARAIERENQTGRPIPRLKGTIDLIFTRLPTRSNENAAPYEIWDRGRLVPISDYLNRYPRPDLIQLQQRMNWLSAGPYGDRAGDILLLARATGPLTKRYAFGAEHYHSWHGSANWSDGNITFGLAQCGGSGELMRKIMQRVTDDQPYENDLTPIVRSLFEKKMDGAR
jgi:Type I phosphodiesterase / nucleotide pyrophosphatase